MFVSHGHVNFNEAKERYVYTEVWQSKAGFDSYFYNWLGHQLGDCEKDETPGTDRYADMPIAGSMDLTLDLENTVDGPANDGFRSLEPGKDAIRFELEFGKDVWVLKITLLDEIEFSTRILSELVVMQYYAMLQAA